MAKGAGRNESAAVEELRAAYLEALFGNQSESRERVAAALKLSTTRSFQWDVAVELARAGEATQAQALADSLAKRYAEATFVNSWCVPMVRAQLALNRNDYAKAIELLQSVTPHDLTFSMSFVYLRGKAYLAAHKGNEAAAEFQKILDHRGTVLNEPVGALAHLQLGRGYALQGDAPKARTAYQDFLTLWKDADPEIPILKQAKAEYAKLQVARLLPGSPGRGKLLWVIVHR